MRKLITISITLLVSQFMFAQSLSPTAVISTARNVSKPNARLSTTVGELNLSAAKPAAVRVDETATMQVYPNPATNFVSFNFEMAQQAKVSVTLTNSIGEKLQDVYSGEYSSGQLTQSMDVSNYQSGLYFLTLQYTDVQGKRHSINRKFQII